MLFRSGTHPHVIQPIDRIRNSDGRDMIVYYSLGYYACWTGSKGKGVADRVVGGMAGVNIVRNGSGDVVIKDYGITPLVCHLSYDKNQVSVYKLDDYPDRLAGSNEIIKQDTNFSRQYCIGLCEEIWGDNIR